MIKYINELEDGSFRDSTKEEIDAAENIAHQVSALRSKKKNIDEKIKEIQSNCKHVVRFYIYVSMRQDDICYCLACGKEVGMI